MATVGIGVPIDDPILESILEAVPAADGSGRPARFRLGNRPPLTGIRALGVSLVLVYHSDFSTLPGSWCALGVFFVLSGFLITAMLSDEASRTGRVHLGNFYSRRALRLLPPLVLTAVLMIIYAAFVPVADASRRLWGDIIAALFYFADYRQALGHAPFFGFLAQTWSLSVEEQFYVIWSVLMMAVVASGRRRLAYVLGSAGLVASVADRLGVTFGAPRFDHATFARIYYAFDTRADALFLGCLLGLLASDGYLTGWSRRCTRAFSVVAAVSGAVMVWVVATAHLWTRDLVIWWIPLTEVASAVIIVYFVVQPDGIGSRLVGLRPLVYVGNLSYTIYLVHFPVYVALEPGTLHWSYWPTMAVRLPVIAAVSVLSWHLMEQRLTRWRRKSLAP